METASLPRIGYGYVRGDLAPEDTEQRKAKIEAKAEELDVGLSHIFVEPVPGDLQDFNKLLGALRLHLYSVTDVVVILNSPQDVGRRRWAQDWAQARLDSLDVRIVFT